MVNVFHILIPLECSSNFHQISLLAMAVALEWLRSIKYSYLRPIVASSHSSKSGEALRALYKC